MVDLRQVDCLADDDHRVGERILALQPGVPHPIARVLEGMTELYTLVALGMFDGRKYG